MNRVLLALALLPATACVDDGTVEDEGPAIIADDKTDAAIAIEVQSRIAPGSVDAVLTAGQAHLGYVLYAAEGSSVTLEVTHAGSAQGLDTYLRVYGPRLADGSYPKTIASDDDAGYGKLSKLTAEVDTSGFYLVELTTPTGVTLTASKKARLKLTCDGVCTSDQPVAPLGNDLKWFQRSAERRALSLQAYQSATARVEELADAGSLGGAWGVILDIDETVLDNSPYQKARGELGVGFSPASWTAWVNQKSAVVLPGAASFLSVVRDHGGKIVFVTNRVASNECAPTEQNLASVGIAYDAILCKTTTSDKNPRITSVVDGTAKPGLAALDVKLVVGDNIQDFPLLTQDLRKQPEAAFAAFGDRFFLIPNPMYGSWEKNLD